MCTNREHRYRVKVTFRDSRSVDVVVLAKSSAEAIARADGFAHRYAKPEEKDNDVIFEIRRGRYSSDEDARQHGAILEG